MGSRPLQTNLLGTSAGESIFECVRPSLPFDGVTALHRLTVFS